MHNEPFGTDQLKPGEGDPFTFAARNRKWLLIVTMITVVFFSVTAAFMLLYNAAFEKQQTHLSQTAISQARLIESISRNNGTQEDEIRAPFLNAGFIVLGLTLLLIWLGSSLMNRIYNPLIRRLQQSVERKKALINTSPNIIYVTEASDSFKPTYISENVKEILGFQPECMINEPDFWINHVHPDDRQHVLTAIQDIHRGDKLVLKYRIRDKWGEFHWIQDCGHLLRDEAGRPRELVGSWEDVSDIKQASGELMRQKEYSENLLQNLSVPTFVIDANHKVIFWNMACERLTGISAEKIIGTNGHWQGFYSEQRPCLADVLLDENRNNADSLFSRYERSTLVSQGIHAENWCTLANNKRHYLVFEAGPIYDREGNMIAAVETLRDLTDHKSLEIELLYSRDTALKAARAKGEFLANMSHEIRTPMNAVLGMLQLVRSTRLTTEQQDFLDTAYNSADALLAIINDILDFSKIEAGMMEMEKIDTDVREIVSDVSTLLSPKAAEKGLELICFTPVDIPALVKGDPTRLRQVLINLIGNAVKFTETGQIVVRVSIENGDPETVRLKFEVEDTGVGISRSSQKKLFEAFSQADDTITRRFGGTGLGLAICKQLLTMMGSELKVESQEGKGSRFYFTIPFEKAVLKEPPKVFKELNGVKALVIDDNITNRLILSHYLDSWGLVVEQADHENSALSMLREKNDQGSPYEIVFLDIQMQGMDGLTLSRAMAKEPGLAQIPRILMTSVDQFKPSEKEAAGISACISKPYNQTLLHDTLLKVLHKQQEPTVFEKSSQRPPDVQGISFDGSKFSLLLVEDNSVNQKVALGLLKKLGFSADVANNGEEAVTKTVGQDYDLVLMDCQMPVMSGYEATETIRMRENEQGLERLCIIAMTANAMAGDREKCLTAGMDDYLAKPVRLESLQTVLVQWLTAGNDKRNSEVNSMTENNHTDSLPVLDKEVVNSLKKIMEEDFEDVIREYLDESLCMLREIHEAIEQENVDVFVRASHSLKSSSANVGAMQVSAIAERLEHSGRTGRIDVKKTSLTDLDNAYDRARNTLDCELQKADVIRG